MNRKIMLGASAGLIGALAVAGAAFAQDGSGGSSPRDSIKDRVAEILGIDRESLDSAMETAREEYRDAKQDEKLASLVEQGTITQQQSDEISAWRDARPDAADELRRPGKDMGRGHGMMPPAAERSIEARLSALVAQEVISQDDANEVLDWYSARPEYLDGLRQVLRGERDGEQHGERHGERHGRHGFMGHGQPGQHADAPAGPESQMDTTFTMPNGSEINF